MAKYKVISYDFYETGKNRDFNDDRHPTGYYEDSDLIVNVVEEGTDNCFKMTFTNVKTYTEISGYVEEPGSYYEPSGVYWDEECTYLEDDSDAELYDIEIISGVDELEEDPSDEELNEILAQIK